RSSPRGWASQLDGPSSSGERRVHSQPMTSAAIAGGTVYASITPTFQATRDVHSAAGISRPPMTARKRRPGRTAPARAMTPRRARASATRPVRACAPMTVNSAISAHRPAGTSAASKSGVRNRGATTATPAVSAMTANAAYSADSPAARGEVNTAPPVAAVATAVLPTATGTDRANAAATAQTTAVNSKTPTVVYCSTDAQLNPRPSVHSPVSAGNQGAVTVAGRAAEQSTSPAPTNRDQHRATRNGECSTTGRGTSVGGATRGSASGSRSRSISLTAPMARAPTATSPDAVPSTAAAPMGTATSRRTWAGSSIVVEGACHVPWSTGPGEKIAKRSGPVNSGVAASRGRPAKDSPLRGSVLPPIVNGGRARPRADTVAPARSTVAANSHHWASCV